MPSEPMPDKSVIPATTERPVAAQPTAFAELESLIRRDPGQRGLVAADPLGPLCHGALAPASRHLAQEGAAVAVVTGFWVAHGDPPAAETDGPSGALFLARALQALGMRVWLIGDPLTASALSAGLAATGMPEEMLLTFPCEQSWLAKAADDEALSAASARSSSATPQHWVDEFFRHGPGSELTHLIAVERPGPSHTLQSLRDQIRNGTAPAEQFQREMPVEHRDQCHNVRGDVITRCTAPTHMLFEYARREQLPVTTIGIGDGGNEIGMGKIPWEELRRRVPGGRGGTIACRIATDYTILAGTSNWGAYALAAGALWWRQEPESLRRWNRDFERHVLEAVVRNGPAVDGVTGRRELTVDGLPFETYIQPLEGMRRLLLS